MTQPMQLPGPGTGGAPRAGRAPGRVGALLAALASLGGTALLGVVAGFVWAAVSPRALLVMTGHGQAGLVRAETSAYIVADGDFILLALAGGALAGLVGYLLAVRRHGPLPMAGLLLGAVAAAYLARAVGERFGLGGFHHLLATLPAGARLLDSLTLGAGSALAFWPMAAGLVAGGMAAAASRGAHRA